ncbi:MAG: phosphoglycerate dehydrogenase, partial [Chloroflexi bacterium]|nr:phosphoglycerate dehydrogenase [Chloroflexota bacterium]
MKVLVCDSISPLAIERMRKACLEVDVNDKVTADELLQIIGGYDAMVVRSRTKVRKPVIDAATNLKVVVRGGVGVDNIDVDYAQARGIKILNTPGASTHSVAELTIGYLFALARPIVQSTASMREGLWEKSRFEGIEIQGKVLGIIGMGRIGTAVATRAAALGMIVLGYDSRTIGPAPFLQMVSLDELFARSDFITLHIPLTEDSRHLINADAVARMKTGVRIVDCARGGVIDEDALYDAIRAGKVAGAALDVFETEPLTDRRLFE